MWPFIRKKPPKTKAKVNPPRRTEYRICLEMEKMFPKNCPVNVQTGDGVFVGACWHYLDDGRTCPVHGVVK